MEQSIVNKGHGSIMSTTMLTEKENQVLEILVEMPRVIFALEAGCRLPFTWGCKRKRSAIHVTPCGGCPRLLSSSSPTPPPLPSHDGGAVVAPSCKTESLAVVKAEASSPATPLSFAPTESDEKPNPLRRKASLKRKREHYLKIIEDLTKSKALLNQEIDNVKRYCDQLKDFNLKLKARKQELLVKLSNGPKSECKNPSLEIGCQMQLVQASVNSSNSMAENKQHQKQQQLQSQMPTTPYYLRLMLNQMPGQPTTSLAVPSHSSSSSALGMVNSNVGPLVIPDLNFFPEDFIPVDSCQPLDVTMANKDLSKAMAAQARQRRYQIYKLKNPIGNSKPRCSHR